MDAPRLVRRVLCAAAVVLIFGRLGGAEPAEVLSWFPGAPPLPAPTGKVLKVASLEELYSAAAEAPQGATILVAEGHYFLSRFLNLRTDGLTLRGASGARERVVLDGERSRHGELVGVSSAEGVTIADLTIQNVRWNGFKINSNTGVKAVTIRNCVFHNIWQRAVKGPAVPAETREAMRPSSCRIEHCLFYNDRPKKFSDDPTDTPETYNGDYVGGIDVMYALDWTISDNIFIGIQGRTRQGRGAIFLWHDSRNCVVERNVFIDCDLAVSLGNSFRGPGTLVHCEGCIVRNNFIIRAPQGGIFAGYTKRSKILHNTIHDPENALQRLIRVAHDNDGLVIAGNLLSGPPIRLENEKGVEVWGNVTADMTASFAGAGEGNLHLTAAPPAAPDARDRLPDAVSDFDGEQRGERPGAGADEVPPAPPLTRGKIKAEAARPARFPHRIWAACDFESLTRDYGWFGPPEKKEIPLYPGNATAIGLAERQSGAATAAMTGINPVPGPKMGKVNKLYLRYYLEGADEATFQHFSLTTEDNNHILVTGLVQGRWTELTLDFTRYGLRNDGTPGVPFKEGERMDDFKVFVGKPGDGRGYRLFLDDIVFFAEDPALPREPEPFPNRVIFLAAFDTGEKEKYWPGDFEIVEKKAPAGAYWRVACSVLSPKGRGKFVRLQIDPIRAVGEHTKLRFRYYLKGASRMTVQVFDLTDKDNRHVYLEGLQEGAWKIAYVDFTRDGKRNDGSPVPFAAGHQVDDLFFFVEPRATGGDVDLFLDEVTLFDAARE